MNKNQFQKPTKNFQKKKYYTNRNVNDNINNRKPNKFYNKSNYNPAPITGWFDKKNNITMEEWVNGLFVFDPRH